MAKPPSDATTRIGATQRAADKAVPNAAERVGVDEEWFLDNVRLNIVVAMRARDLSAAARSFELIGRHLSMFIDRKQR